jgi:hypothetical protein
MLVLRLSQETQMLTWHFVAPMVHDFAWAAEKIMHISK